MSTHEQQQLLARASDLELEQRQHVDAAAEAARIAAAAAARAAELETEIRVEVTERRTLLLQQEEVSCLRGMHNEGKRGWGNAMGGQAAALGATDLSSRTYHMPHAQGKQALSTLSYTHTS